MVWIGLVDRGNASAKGDVFYVPFFGAKERNQRKALKGIRGGLFHQGQALMKRHMPLPPLGSPNTPLGEPIALQTEGELLRLSCGGFYSFYLSVRPPRWIVPVTGVCLCGVFVASFLGGQERGAKKPPRGIRGGFRGRKRSFRLAPQPLPPWIPQHPIGGVVRSPNRGGVTTPFLRGFLQLLFVGAPTEMDGGLSRPFVSSASEKEHIRLCPHGEGWLLSRCQPPPLGEVARRAP